VVTGEMSTAMLFGLYSMVANQPTWAAIVCSAIMCPLYRPLNTGTSRLSSASRPSSSWVSVATASS
jgi:hypothetical protein